MRRKIWMQDPHAGGTTIPSAVRQETERRIRAYAQKRYAGAFSRLNIRFHGALCYIDAYVEPGPPSCRLLHVLQEARDLNRVREVPLHLCRLRYFGGRKIWSMAFYTYSNERYEPCTFRNGTFYGTPEEAFEVGAVHLRVLSAVTGPRPRKKRAAEHHASAVRRARGARSPAAERARSTEIGRRMSVAMKGLGTSLLFLGIWSTAAPIQMSAEERWVTSIATSNRWAVFPCKSYMVTNVCGTDKDYSDAGSLPSTISVGDTVTYTNKKGERKEFVVRQITFFVYEKDIDTTWGGQRLKARKGDTTCTLYDARTRAATEDTQYPSKVIVKDCRAIR